MNTTDSAVRITHLPTGIVVTCQNERSQLQNKARAMQVLAARLQSLAEEQASADASADRASQIRTVDRSERIRTYNFPENRIADHRINFKAHNLDQVLDGDLDALVRRAGRGRPAGPAAERVVSVANRPATMRQLIDAATDELAAAGVGSPRVDAELLAAHVAGTDRGRLAFTAPGNGFAERFGRLVARRAERVPLQHLTGVAAFGPVDLHVGPGVFVPRPETEALLEWALTQPLPPEARHRRPVHRFGCAGRGTGREPADGRG